MALNIRKVRFIEPVFVEGEFYQRWGPEMRVLCNYSVSLKTLNGIRFVALTRRGSGDDTLIPISNVESILHRRTLEKTKPPEIINEACDTTDEATGDGSGS